MAFEKQRMCHRRWSPSPFDKLCNLHKLRPSAGHSNTSPKLRDVPNTAPQTEKLRKVSKEKANCCFLHLPNRIISLILKKKTNWWDFFRGRITNSELEMHTQTKDGDLGELGELRKENAVGSGDAQSFKPSCHANGSLRKCSTNLCSGLKQKKLSNSPKSQKKKIHKKTCSADGRNPANQLIWYVYIYIFHYLQGFYQFHPSQVVQDFFHQQ